jgi:hypothetical protein
LSRSEFKGFESFANQSALFASFDKNYDFVLRVVFENPHQVPGFEIFRSENVILDQSINSFLASESRMLDEIDFGIEEFLKSFTFEILVNGCSRKKDLLDAGHLLQDGLHDWQLF